MIGVNNIHKRHIDYYNTLTSNEKCILSEYIAGNIMRPRVIPLPDGKLQFIYDPIHKHSETSKTINIIKDIINRAPRVNVPFIVYRGLLIDENANKQNKYNKTFYNLIPFSTSLYLNPTIEFGGLKWLSEIYKKIPCCIFKIKIPSNFPFLYVGGIKDSNQKSISQFPTQYEVILPPCLFKYDNSILLTKIEKKLKYRIVPVIIQRILDTIVKDYGESVIITSVNSLKNSGILLNTVKEDSSKKVKKLTSIKNSNKNKLIIKNSNKNKVIIKNSNKNKVNIKNSNKEVDNIKNLNKDEVSIKNSNKNKVNIKNSNKNKVNIKNSNKEVDNIKNLNKDEVSIKKIDKEAKRSLWCNIL
jgi:hypothetical protein